jgi:methylenetetrahydrofolate dehydrogenase (NADP+)/methenyltetrahydrofolate cyclohydrolase
MLMSFFNRALQAGFIIPNLASEQEFFPTTHCKILNGKRLSANFVEQAQRLCKGKITPCLAVVLVGEDPASHVYVNHKIKVFAEAGFQSKRHLFSSSEVTEKKLIQLIQALNHDDSIHGILVQLPLPNHLNPNNILKLINPKKDVDGFLASNIGALTLGELNVPLACTPLGILTMLSAYGIDICGKHAVIIGRSNIVGKPTAMLLLNSDATVTMTHSKTKNLKDICQSADILIAAAGQAEFVTQSFIKQNAVVIDVGIHKKADGKLCGDVASDAKQIASALSPVPGGVGPMTIAMLMLNTALAAWS